MEVLKKRKSATRRDKSGLKGKLVSLLTVSVFGLTLATGAMAQNFTTDVGSSERINLAGQLGTLSQRIIASACNLNADIAVAESNAVLQISSFQFDRIRDALLFGNRGFGILGEEGRPRTLQVISELSSVWAPALDIASATAVGANDVDQMAALANESDAVLDIASILVSEITGQYADPVALLHADALLIDLAGRQRLLAEQMSKDICLIASGINVTAAQEDLRKTSKLFDDTLDALRNGLDSVGVRPPPTQKIADSLQFVVDEWEDLQPALNASLSGIPLSDDMRQQVFYAFLGMEARMNNVVVLYDKNSKLGL